MAALLRSPNDTDGVPPMKKIDSVNEMMAQLLDKRPGTILTEQEKPTCWFDPFCWKDFHPRKLAKELPQFLASCVVYCIGVYTNSFSQAWLQKYKRWVHPVAPHANNETVLWDVGFKNLPRLDIVFIRDVKLPYLAKIEVNLPDFMAGVAVSSMVVRFLICPGPLSMRWTILRRLLFLSGMMFFLRAFSIVSTVLPSPDTTCKCMLDDTECTEADLENVWWFAFQVFLLRGVTCEDVLFSGHTVAVTISLMFFIEFEHKAPWFTTRHNFQGVVISSERTVKLASLCFSGLAYVCIIGSRFHYTADVFVGFMLTVMAVRGYHHMIKSALMAQENILYKYVRWFEKHAVDLNVWHTLSCKRARERDVEDDIKVLQDANVTEDVAVLLAQMRVVTGKGVRAMNLASSCMERDWN